MDNLGAFTLFNNKKEISNSTSKCQSDISDVDKVENYSLNSNNEKEDNFLKMKNLWIFLSNTAYLDSKDINIASLNANFKHQFKEFPNSSYISKCAEIINIK